ncbi:MAG TPA: T9SS type A sorting domain-containing protein, partial [Pelobium sp.]|nr:T9SS type A sorting domain-containing protein [Pelobium sp.]
EKSNNFFTISKSRDGQTFEKLVNVNSKGDNGATYSTIDFSPFAGTSYYKLSQTDADGKKEELGIKTIKLADLKEQGLSVYPNPVVNGIVNIRSTESNGLQNVLVYDLNGKEVYKEQLIFTNGTATYKLNKHMIKGTYILRIEGVERSVKIVVE